MAATNTATLLPELLPEQNRLGSLENYLDVITS